MATAVTVPAQDPDLVYASFPIEKFDEDPATGTLYVYGKATSPDLDSDDQVVDSDWSASAMEAWFKSGPNVRVMHNPTAMPAGSGVKVEINRDGDGGHWVKAAVDDPTAKLMVQRKHLRAFSVGIARPLIVNDVTGKARGGIIKGGELAEISLVDRPANRSCYVEIAKSDSDGSCEFTGKVVGGDILAKGTPFNPNDMAKLVEARRIAEQLLAEKAAAEAAKGELSAADRRNLPASAFAYVDSNGDGHLPVHDEGHVRSALGRFGEQQFDNSKSKRRAARKIVGRAKQFGIDVDTASDVAQAAGKLAQPDAGKSADGMEPCGLCKGKGKIRGGKLDCPRCHGDGKISMGETDEHGDSQDKAADAGPDLVKTGARDCPGCGKGHDADSPSKFCADCGHKLPAMSEKEGDPDLVKASGDDDAQADSQAPDSGGTGEDGPNDSDDDDGDDDDDPAATAKAAAPAAPMAKPKVPCPSCGKQVKAKMPFCPKCGGAMKAKADKAGKPTPGDGVTGEHTAPVPAHREPDGPAIESLEHDAGLPTDPDSKYEKAAGARIDALGVPYPLGALHDRLCPAYQPGSAAKAHPGYGLADIDVADWAAKAMEAATQPGDWLEEATKAQALWQHATTIKGLPPETADEIGAEMHKAFADANPGPGTFPTPAELTPQRFRRPYITAGHAAPSPQQDGPNTAAIPPAGGITATDYTRGYLDAGHAADSPQNKADGSAPPMPGPSNSGRTFYRNTARDNAKSAMQAMHDHIAQTFPDLCPMHSDPNAGPMPAPNPLPRPAGSSKAAEADAGKDGKPAKEKKAKTPAAENRAPGMDPGVAGAGTVDKAAGIASPDLVKAAMAELVSPLLAQLAESHELLKTQNSALETQNAALEAQAEMLAKAFKKQSKTLDAIAGQPDQNGPYRGAPMQQYQAEKAMAPAALSPAEAAARSQQMVYEELHSTWRNSPDATARLAAEEAMAKMRGIPSGSMITA